jgi:hypothetical protein
MLFKVRSVKIAAMIWRPGEHHSIFSRSALQSNRSVATGRGVQIRLPDHFAQRMAALRRCNGARAIVALPMKKPEGCRMKLVDTVIGNHESVLLG